MLEHPFYVRWSAGELSRDELATYAGQYRHATEALAKLCADTAGLAPDSHREEIERHASEEQDHIRLWDDFVEAAGGEIGAEPTAETADCVQTWTESNGPSALARLYAIESGQPEISRIKREGLARFYGIDGGTGSEYFRVHEASDEAHAEESRRLIEEAMSRATRTRSLRRPSPPSAPIGASWTASLRRPGWARAAAIESSGSPWASCSGSRS